MALLKTMRGCVATPKATVKRLGVRPCTPPYTKAVTKTIELSIVKAPAIRPSPQEDPLFFIAGGLDKAP